MQLSRNHLQRSGNAFRVLTVDPVLEPRIPDFPDVEVDVAALAVVGEALDDQPVLVPLPHDADGARDPVGAGQLADDLVA